jgi:malate dehydrogenase (oxaloacetate-decarboxylating)(NADP+)
MKMAAAKALAALAKEEVPQEVIDAMPGRQFVPGSKEYVIPTPFDPRLIEVLPCAVAQAAMDSGVARTNIEDFDAYKIELKARVSKN